MPTEADPPGETSIGSDVAPIPPAASEEKKSEQAVKGSTATPPDAASPAGPPPPSPIATLQAEKDQVSRKLAETTTEDGQSSKETSAEDTATGKSAAGENDKDKGEPHGPAPSSAGENTTPLGPDGVPLQEATFIYWASLDEDIRKVCYLAIDEYFHNLLEDFRVNANAAVKNYTRFGKWNTGWRLLLIISTGGLAIVNVLAANDATKGWSLLGMKLSLAAAVYAASLALLTNLESFLNYTDKKSSTRESRELYLDAYRQFEMLRLTHVYPYGYSAQACFNFNEIYRRLVMKDLELRRKIMQLSTSRTGLGKA